MPNRIDYERAKVPDPELRSFADGDSHQRQNVLIELVAEPSEVVMGERDWGQPSRRALAIGSRDEEATVERMARLRGKLVAILGEEPVRLDVAEAFVADVTADQLCQIARIADVGCIRPNRRHRVG